MTPIEIIALSVFLLALPIAGYLAEKWGRAMGLKARSANPGRMRFRCLTRGHRWVQGPGWRAVCDCGAKARHIEGFAAMSDEVLFERLLSRAEFKLELLQTNVGRRMRVR